MKALRHNRRAFANQLFIGVLVTLCCGGSVGLGTVWMRHQISVTARVNRGLEASLAEIERHSLEADAAIETEQNYDRLRRRNEDWRLGLAPMSDAQVAVLPIGGDPVRAMAARANQELFTDLPVRGARATETPVRVTFQVASRR